MPNLVILTGAGISAESGISTFRDANGLWETYRIEDVASPHAFRRDPETVHRFYNLRRAQLKTVSPNVAHFALAALERAWVGQGDFLLVTQNVDDLHERAGSKNLLYMHGEMLKLRCAACGDARPHKEDITTEMACAACDRGGGCGRTSSGSAKFRIIWTRSHTPSTAPIFSALSVRPAWSTRPPALPSWRAITRGIAKPSKSTPTRPAAPLPKSSPPTRSPAYRAGSKG